MDLGRYEKFMREAIKQSLKSIKAGQSPFGAVVVKGGKLVARAHNTVRSSSDPTAHAEVNALRKAARKLGGISLKGCTLFSSCEPCPMCFASAHWADIDEIVYGASIADAKALGFRELSINGAEFSTRGSKIRLVPGLLREEALEAMRKWKGEPY